MFSLTDPERQLLERLAAEGKASRLYEGDLPIAKSLEGVGLLFLIWVTLPSDRHAGAADVVSGVRWTA